MPPIRGKDPLGLQIVSPVLTNLVRAYKPEGLVGDIVAPKIPVAMDSAQYPIWDNFFDVATPNKVGDRAETPEISFELSLDSYLCEDYRLKGSLTAKEIRNAHSVVRLRQTTAEVVKTQMALSREMRIAAQLTKESNGGQLKLGGGVSQKWNAGANATIETDIKAASLAVYRATGKRTNAIIIPFEVAYEMALDPKIREQIKYTVNGQEVISLGDRVLPGTLHGHRVIIPEGSMRNTAKEGQDQVLADIWEDHVRLIFLPNGGGPNNGAAWGNPATMYTFESEPEKVDTWVQNDPPVEYIRNWETVDEKVCAPKLGYEIRDVL